MNRKKGFQVSVDPFIFLENVEIDRAASPLRRRRPAGRGERPCRVLAQLRRLQRALGDVAHHGAEHVLDGAGESEPELWQQRARVVVRHTNRQR